MAVRQIRVFGDPVLKTVCQPVLGLTPELQAHLQDLLDTVDFDGRAGLASNQIGHTVRAFSLNINAKKSVIYNPELVEVSGEPVPTGEGCLSVPDLWFEVVRYPQATVKGFNEHGEEIVISGQGLLAQALQHELDHLDGKLYIERLDPPQRQEAMKRIRSSSWF